MQRAKMTRTLPLAIWLVLSQSCSHILPSPERAGPEIAIGRITHDGMARFVDKNGQVKQYPSDLCAVRSCVVLEPQDFEALIETCKRR
jgi:hypothetical protein